MILISLVIGNSAFATLPQTLPLMPWPKNVTEPAIKGTLKFDYQVGIRVIGDDEENIISQVRTRLINQTGWTLSPLLDKVEQPTIDIIINKKVNPIPLPDSDESYSLNINSSGIKLTAQTRFGALRGIETLLQLIQSDTNIASVPYITINDSPRFPWRGVLIDSARHFFSIADIKRQIDGMAAAKMNVLHWHLTDDQGWRFASKRYPKLQEKASDGLFYTQEQMREIVRYAATYGIRVVPEVDMPGHASAIAVAYPELISAVGPYKMERNWGVLKPILDPTKEKTYEFVDAIIGELADIFPDPYIHIGGDEVEGSQWKNNTAIQAFMKKNNLQDNNALQARFNQKLAVILEKHQKKMVGWDEIFHPDLPKNIMIQSWQGQDALGKVAQSGHSGILSTGFYLDQPQYTSYHYRNGIIPQSIGDIDVITADDSAQSWIFDMPRLKGSAVQGTFTLVKRNNTWRGFIDFKGKSRRIVNNIQWVNKNQVMFTVDTWMGPTQPVVTLDAQNLSGYILVGNVRYPVSGHRLNSVPKGIYPVVPEKSRMKNLQGGEVALWAENIVPSVLDIKLWPRTFAVAERLWSTEEMSDVNNMYQRLQAVDSWSTVSVGLQQHSQQLVQFIRLANSTDILPLQIFSQALEPAHYYTRHHLKYLAGNYNQFETLNRLADTLPAESNTVRKINELVDSIIENKDEQSALVLRKILNQWRNNSTDMLILSDKSTQLKTTRPIVRQVEQLSTIGLYLIDKAMQHKTLNVNEINNFRQQLNEMAKVQQEIVIAAVYPVEKLLNSLTLK